MIKLQLWEKEKINMKNMKIRTKQTRVRLKFSQKIDKKNGEDKLKAGSNEKH